MRHLYIIGNGFDLAHGLKTSYRDFILWYLGKKVFEIFNHPGMNKEFNDNLISYKWKIYSAEPVMEKSPEIKSAQEFLDHLTPHIKTKRLTYSPSPLLEAILKEKEKGGWSDIERDYYKLMVNALNPISSPIPEINIKELNKSFDALKKELEAYLTKKILPEIESKTKIPALRDIFLYEKKDDWLSEQIEEEQMFLNFNYTNTIEKYQLNQSYKTNYKIINIHGSVNNTNDPIIFGYGDEMEEHFKEIENKDDNEYLRNMKSFGYFQTDNYKSVLEFMNDKEGRKNNDFKVHVIGHSMGLSDRLLLNTVFEHPNCKSIEIHYSKKMDNFYDLARNMSRHFNYEMKGAMREKFVPYLNSNLKSRPMN